MKRLLLSFTALAAFGCSAHALDLVIKDEAPWHVHKVGSPFRIQLQIKDADEKTGPLRYYWKDELGRRLSEDVILPADAAMHTIAAPSGEAGYYGLVVTPIRKETALPYRQPGEEREYGFVVFPASQKLEKGNADAQFGLVHAYIEDPYIPAWVKTATWQTTGAQWWLQLLQKRTQQGKIELPIITDGVWKTDNDVPVSENELETLRGQAEAFFAADPVSRYWEAGLEETLNDGTKKKYYWENLTRKLKTLHEAAQNAGRDIKFIYQVASTEWQDVENVFSSQAIDYIDILSIHPYKWPDFPDPEKWFAPFMTKVHAIETAHHHLLPIWFTEVGAPHFGNYEGGFFGYPEAKNKTGGLSRALEPVYMVKLCTMALANGVEKIFWYNYKDAGAERDHAETHFGLIDYWGFPKPAYAAYHQMTYQLEHHRFEGSHPQNEMQDYRFTGKTGNVDIVWSVKPKEIAFSSFGDQVAATDIAGRPVKERAGVIPVGASPVFIVSKR